MTRRSYRGSLSALQNDPIRILKAEHNISLLRLDAIERSLQFLESLPRSGVREDSTDEQTHLRDCLISLQHLLELHFLKEEEALFPVLAEYIGRAGGPIDAVVDEHTRIRSALGDLRQKVTDLCEYQGGERTAILSGVTGLAYKTTGLLRLHICKENQILFEIGEDLLSTEEKRKIAIKIKTM